MDYLLKSTLLSATLYAFYKAFLERETFFQSNRLFFVIGIFIALFLPLLLIPIEVVVETQDNLATPDFIPLLNEVDHTKIGGVVLLEDTIDWMTILLQIYVIGVGIFTLKFLSEVVALAHLIYTNPRKRKDNYIQVETRTAIAPFSFFIWIVFTKNQFTTTELRHIINHEKVHVKQGHSFDMLFIQLLTIIQWFNPFVWLLKKELQQNLEFIADKKVKETIIEESSLKDYQYLLLKTGIGKDPFATTNNFFNSHLKKRIIMLQKSKTNRFNQIKYVLVLPLLALFMYSFSTKEVLVVKNTNNVYEKTSKQNQENKPIQFVRPLDYSKLTRMASGYGMRMHPVLKIKKMYLGTDFKAPKGTAVYAAAKGVVIAAETAKTLGKIVRIKHAQGYQTNYYHLSELLVKKGDSIQVGSLIAKVGSTGESSAPHLHFEVLKNGEHINPLTVLPKTSETEYKRDDSLRKTENKQVREEKAHNKIISKDTSQKELDKIEEYYQKLGIELIFAHTKRNQKGEIISLSIQAKTEYAKANFNASFSHPIDPITIEYKDGFVNFYSKTTQTKKSASQEAKSSQFQYKTLAISNINTLNKDSTRPVGIVELDSLAGKKTMYIITEQTNEGNQTQSVHIQTSSINDNFEISNLTDEVTIMVNDETGETSFTINGKTYSEESIKKLKEIGTAGLEMIRYNNLEDQKSIQKKREKILTKRQERTSKINEKRLRVQEKRLKANEKRLKKQEKLLRKREEALRKRLERQNPKEKETGYMQYQGKDYYYAGDTFYNKFGEVVSKKLAIKLRKLKV